MWLHQRATYSCSQILALFFPIKGFVFLPFITTLPCCPPLDSPFLCCILTQGPPPPPPQSHEGAARAPQLWLEPWQELWCSAAALKCGYVRGGPPALYGAREPSISAPAERVRTGRQGEWRTRKPSPMGRLLSSHILFAQTYGWRTEGSSGPVFLFPVSICVKSLPPGSRVVLRMLTPGHLGVQRCLTVWQRCEQTYYRWGTRTQLFLITFLLFSTK